ncbi:1-deoxy-D-xylulose-5-phosphate reductoisomerase [bacterium]|jgi:1-deoxy-D-xylulose-5-phosphate reductoisomerase|nr:1-deoxy-D-xylulose-5-phosphate reductoisomerase [bacterium]MBT3581433.1 1-deoxy-D-xylulose-5-phosphate reductoisomerase [bacterium]MBT4552527.1 1-deoxy-D-xylulose-5-phosphate reductoisomerase [bacterium]MBT5988418.1 1-deoxy-D-xylulose-5-phosphate reductoisomerase [bacterium]MBT7088366.1 1-deoxy-D-xylulose-5-phosphate reductoisomerase [bacterium]
MKKISILGSTGSVGTQTLQVIEQFPEEFQVVSLAAGKNISLFKEQIKKFKPLFVAVYSDKEKDELAKELEKENIQIEIFSGQKGLLEIATASENELLIVAISGTASLAPTYKAIQAKISIALACKEVLVAAGSLIMAEAKKNGVSILPIDSEHAALKQCLASVKEDSALVQKVILTASGGPFWKLPKSEFKDITVEMALKHPNWTMGSKITIDSATMMNKGLEVIEAHHFYGLEYEKIKVLFHPQSVVHALAEFVDGNMIAQMGPHDMRFPIQYALTYPKKLCPDWARLNLAKVAKLEFYEPDFDKFPLLRLAYETGEKGGSAPVIMNASNEAAVSLFLRKKIKFLDIYKIVQEAVDNHVFLSNPTIEHIIRLDHLVKDEIFAAYE